MDVVLQEIVHDHALQGSIILHNEDAHLTITAFAKGPGHSRMSRPCHPPPASMPPVAATTAPRCRIACLLLALVSLNAASPTTAQSPALQARAAQEPITPIPAMPAQDPRRLRLGERLFSDRRLSHDDTHSCSSCHDIRTNGASANAHDLTPDGRPLALNAPTVFNASLNFRLNWEGNVRTLEEHAERTLGNPEIMASSADEVVGKLRADPEAVRQFRDAYGRELDVAALLDAIATYERSLVTPGGRFDRWLGGEGRRDHAGGAVRL